MKVDIVPYNPAWKQKYEIEAARIKQACGDKILNIEHGGSTGIEGIAAKPVIDIYVGVKKLADADAIIPKMKELHYEYVTKYESDFPFRRFFTKDINDARAFNVHTVEASHTFRRDDLLFKDYLKVDNKAFSDYENLKIELAKQEWETSLGYNEAKTEFITLIKAKALNYFSKLYERTESEVTYLMHSYSTNQERSRAEFKMIHQDGITAIRSGIFTGFSLNRALGFSHINESVINGMKAFFEGKPGKHALQVPPFILDDMKIKFLNSHGYNYSNSWITFYRDSSPIDSQGTDLEIREIGKEHANVFAHTLNEVFGFPHEFDGVAASSLGEKEWITFMAFDGSKTAGSAGVCIVGDCGYLSFANVLPEYRRRGIQGELMKRRIDAARERGAKWIIADTAETSDEHPNPSYWNMLRYGFRQLYNRPNYVRIL